MKFLINERWVAFRQSNFGKYNSLKIKVKKEIILAKQNWVRRESIKSKRFWSVVSDIVGNKTKGVVSNLLNKFDSIDTLVNEINCKFCTNYLSPKQISKLPDIYFHNDWLIKTDRFEVATEISKMTKKSGPKSELPSRLYNGAVISLASPICTIINQSFEILVTPLAWKNAEVTPIPKCSPVNINELRPISLLCIPNKIAERII